MEPELMHGMEMFAGIWAIVGLILGLGLGLVWLIVSIWVGFDASSKHQPGFPWFLLAATLFPVGLTAWLVLRPMLPKSRR